MAGRKRKSGRRDLSGRPRRETAYEVREPVLRRICRQLGLSETHENIDRARKLGCHAWGKACLAGAISFRQYQAADAYAVARHAYVVTMGLPSGSPVSGSVLDAGGRSLVPEGEDARARRKRALYEALRAATGQDAVLVEAFILEHMVDMDRLRAALDFAADHLRIPETETEEDDDQTVRPASATGDAARDSD